MLNARLVTAVADYVAWSHLTSGYTLQMEDKRHSGISIKHIQGFGDKYLHMGIFQSSLGFGSGLNTIDLIRTYTSILYVFPQLLSSVEDNTALFPLIYASCVIKVIVDSCLPPSPRSDSFFTLYVNPRLTLCPSAQAIKSFLV